MTDKLRKVIYFNPEMLRGERIDKNTYRGYFHQFIDDGYKALIEREDGILLHIYVNFMRFEEWNDD